MGKFAAEEIIQTIISQSFIVRLVKHNIEYFIIVLSFVKDSEIKHCSIQIYSYFLFSNFHSVFSGLKKWVNCDQGKSRNIVNVTSENTISNVQTNSSS
jgi:hypothetical protein